MQDAPTRPAPTWHTALYVTVAGVVGAAVMALEMVASRFLAPVFGGSLLTWAALIAVVMVALAAGYGAGGRLADRWPTPTGAAGALLVAACYLLLAARHGGAWVDAIAARTGDPHPACLLAAAALTFVPSALLATWAPWALRLTVARAEHAGRVAGRLYGASTLGSVVGTLVTAFVLIPSVGSGALLQQLSWAVLAAGIAVGITSRNATSRRARVALAAPLLLFVGLWLVDRGPQATSTAPVVATGAADDADAVDAAQDGIVEHRESLYNDIYVVREGDYLSLRFARDSRFFSETRIHRDDPSELPLVYNRLLLAGLAYPPRLESLLMLGLGGGSVTRFLHHNVPELEITGVELDADVIELARRHFDLSGVDAEHADARLYLQGTDRRYDVIVADTYRGGVVPFHLLTREFFELVRTRMTVGGCLVVNMHAGTRLFDSVVATLRAVFPTVDAYRSAASGNVALVASAQTVAAAALASRASERQARHGFAYHLRSLLELRVELDTDPEAQILVDDFAPASYLAAIQQHNDALTQTRPTTRPQIEAQPLDGIRVDGDLSDWPPRLTEHGVLTNGRAYGATDIDGADLRTSADLSARFLVGWNPDESLVYVALRVRDDARVADGNDHITNDAVELYLARDADAPAFTGDAAAVTAAEIPVLQYIAVPGPGGYMGDGQNPVLARGDIGATRSRAAWRRDHGVTVYEWALQVVAGVPARGVDLRAGDVLGFEVVVVDYDGGGMPSWIHWAPAKPRKYADPSALGMLRLAAP